MLVQGCPLCFIASVTRRFFHLTQFIRSHGCLLVMAISVIFSLKNLSLADLTDHLNFFQLSMVLAWQYVCRSLLHSWSHYSLECLVIFFSLEKWFHVVLKMSDMSLVSFSTLSAVLRLFDLRKNMLVKMYESYFVLSSLLGLMDHLRMVVFSVFI